MADRGGERRSADMVPNPLYPHAEEADPVGSPVRISIEFRAGPLTNDEVKPTVSEIRF